MLQGMRRAARAVWTHEDGAAGWLIVGIVIGAALVVFAIIKFLIPGE